MTSRTAFKIASVSGCQLTCLGSLGFFLFSLSFFLASFVLSSPSSSSELLKAWGCAGLLVERFGGWRLMPASAVQSEYSLEESLREENEVWLGDCKRVPRTLSGQRRLFTWSCFHFATAIHHRTRPRFSPPALLPVNKRQRLTYYTLKKLSYIQWKHHIIHF